MKQVIFKELILCDFRGQSRQITFSPKTDIRGRNKSGKSTIWDALCWLFTGYDSLNRSNYLLFDDTIIPTKENSKPASVELVCVIDGMEYRIKRIAERGWTRPRGKDYYEKKQSDDYTFEIDGVSTTAGAYKEFIEKTFCGIDKLKFIVNIDYYLSLDWKELRKHFADIIGEITQDDYTGDLATAFALINKYGTLEAAREHIKSKRNPMRDDIGDKAAKGRKYIELETLESTLPDISGIDNAKARYDQITEEIKNVDEQIKGRADSVSHIINQRYAQIAEIDKLKKELREQKIAYEDANQDKVRELESKRNDIVRQNRVIDDNNRALLREQESKSQRLVTLTRKLASLKEYRERLLVQNREVKSLTFKAEVCSFCGQELPEEMLTAAREQFEKEKTRKHQQIVAEGKSNNEEMARIEAEIAELHNTQKIEMQQPVSTASIDAEITRIKAEMIPFEETLMYQEKQAVIAKKTASVVEIEPVSTEDLDERKKYLFAEQKDCIRIMTLKETYDAQMARILKLKEYIKNTAIELARLEGILADFDNIEKQKAEIIRRKVSALFSLCEIEMEERKKDGTMTPCCNVIVNGVKAQVTNTADKMRAGIDIAKAFSRFYGLNFPIVIDNAERLDASTVDDILSGTDTQCITMAVDDCPLTIL